MLFYDDYGAPPNNPSEPSKNVRIPSNGLPNIESLRNNGLQMMQAYTVSPKCGTSRYSTM
jgi:arylsulfatase A-like enzyme